jgi:hypothetical protein
MDTGKNCTKDLQALNEDVGLHALVYIAHKTKIRRQDTLSFGYSFRSIHYSFGSGANPASYPMGTGDFSSGVKRLQLEATFAHFHLV